MILSEKERNSVAWLLKRRRQRNESGNYTDRFGEGAIGLRLLNKMHAAGWLDQTGWFLSGRPCFLLNKQGLKEARECLRLRD